MSQTFLNLHIDESLFFANATMLEELIYKRIEQNREIAHVILVCSAINEADFSALETLLDMNRQLLSEGIQLHLSEVKGPVLDKLNRVHFIDKLGGNLYLTQHQAFSELRCSSSED